MFRNYLKVAWRNLWRNKVFSFINIVGLAVGLACFLLITLYVRDELGYDRHHQNANRIYRMTRLSSRRMALYRCDYVRWRHRLARS